MLYFNSYSDCGAGACERRRMKLDFLTQTATILLSTGRSQTDAVSALSSMHGQQSYWNVSNTWYMVGY